jgi:hypothetical protein
MARLALECETFGCMQAFPSPPANMTHDGVLTAVRRLIAAVYDYFTPPPVGSSADCGTRIEDVS